MRSNIDSFIPIAGGWINLAAVLELRESPHEGREDPSTREWVAPPCLLVLGHHGDRRPIRVLCGSDAETVRQALQSLAETIS